MTQSEQPRPSSAFGYDTDTVQTQFQARTASGPAQFLLPHLKAGMSLLDCGCGPGSVTRGLAEIVAPGEVVGCDLAPGMIDRANQANEEANIANLSFRVGDILDLPFDDGVFDATFSSAVTEHLSNPVDAVRELARVTKSGGLVAITRTDWTGPLMSPDSPAMSRFFELLEAGFRTQGGTMNGGRHLRAFTREAGLQEVEFFAQYINATNRDMVKALVSDYVEWLENMSIFERLVTDGVVSRDELEATRNAMWNWSEDPNAYLGVTVCRIVTRRP